MRDEQVAAEPKIAPPELPLNAVSSPMETYFGRMHRHPEVDPYLDTAG